MSKTEPVVIAIDPEEAKKNPFPLLHRLREEDPVHWTEEIDCWLITRYEDVRDLFTDPRVSPDRRHMGALCSPARGQHLPLDR